jgi:hypothetical protein
MSAQALSCLRLSCGELERTGKAVAKVEMTEKAENLRFISIDMPQAKAKPLSEKIYSACIRSRAELQRFFTSCEVLRELKM